MKPFSESLRYEYDLTPDSLVIDAGGFEGNWFSEIFRRYGCWIDVYEPSYRHHMICSIAAFDLGATAQCRIRPFHAGLGGSARSEKFKVSGDGSGVFAPEGRDEVVDIWDASTCLTGMNISVLKLNIEGMEYEVLESLIDAGDISKIKNIQCQFHNCVPNWEDRYHNLCKELGKTHEQEWDSAPIWTNWRLR